MTSTRSLSLLVRELLLRSRLSLSRKLKTKQQISCPVGQSTSQTSNRHIDWLEVRQTLQKFWFRIVGAKGQLNVRRIRKVWRMHVGVRDDYFVKVIHNSCQRDSNLSFHLLNMSQNGNNQKELVISNMAQYLFDFFDTIVTEEVLSRPSVIRDMSYNLGRKHAHFSTDSYSLTYWDTLNLAMMEELENSVQFDEIDLRAWQKLIAMINEWMFVGYLKGRDDLKQELNEKKKNNNKPEQQDRSTVGQRRLRFHE
ncbi:hypothetical protein M3Y95_01097800 [Aphelenchoides besseyi]|nr:hypothetical protein M3Y95_01097800 [Aphelenchoides besseyi]